MNPPPWGLRRHFRGVRRVVDPQHGRRAMAVDRDRTMKPNIYSPQVSLGKALALLTLTWVLATQIAAGQGTTFTYQGQLTESGWPANGLYDLRFSLYDSASGGSAVGGPLTNAMVAVSNGLFTATLDFGAGVFTGAERWLEIAVRGNGVSAFTPVSPRQPTTPTPYAIRAANFS